MNERLQRFVRLTDRNSILNEFTVNKNGDFDFRPVVHSLVMMLRRCIDDRRDETIALNHQIVAALMATKVFQEQPRKINTEIAELCIKFGSAAAAAALVDFMVANFKRGNAVAGVSRLVITEEYLGFLALWLEKTDWPLPFRYLIQRQDKSIVASNIDLVASMIGFAFSRDRITLMRDGDGLCFVDKRRPRLTDATQWFINLLYERWPDQLVLKFVHRVARDWYIVGFNWYIRNHYGWLVPTLAVWARIQWAHFFELALVLAPLGLPHYVVLW